MSEHEREQWARGHGTMLDLERRGVRMSVGRRGLGANQSGAAHLGAWIGLRATALVVNALLRGS